MHYQICNIDFCDTVQVWQIQTVCIKSMILETEEELRYAKKEKVFKFLGRFLQDN